MDDFRTQVRYGAGAQVFHWLTAATVLAAFIISAGGPESRVYSPERASQLQLHETLGLAVFVLTILRLVWRLMDNAPDDPPMAVWMHISSRVVQAGLFVLLVVTPVTAILGAWLEGHPLFVAGLGSIAPLVPTAHATGQFVTEAHSWLGDALIWLAGLHAAAALFHHFVLRDRVLVSMLPRG